MSNGFTRPRPTEGLVEAITDGLAEGLQTTPEVIRQLADDTSAAAAEHTPETASATEEEHG